MTISATSHGSAENFNAAYCDELGGFGIGVLGASLRHCPPTLCMRYTVRRGALVSLPHNAR
jgi:hypothetical protein